MEECFSRFKLFKWYQITKNTTFRLQLNHSRHHHPHYLRQVKDHI